jgi:hypothetical protein
MRKNKTLGGQLLAGKVRWQLAVRFLHRGPSPSSLVVWHVARVCGGGLEL